MFPSDPFLARGFIRNDLMDKQITIFGNAAAVGSSLCLGETVVVLVRTFEQRGKKNGSHDA